MPLGGGSLAFWDSCLTFKAPEKTGHQTCGLDPTARSLGKGAV